MYKLGGDVKSFAIENGFTTTLSKVGYAWGNTLTPFCIYADEYQKGVLDVASFGGLEGTDSVVEEVYQQRKKDLEAEGIHVEDTEEARKILFLHYLLTVSVCYVEIEKYVTKLGVAQKTYDKGLYTRSPKLIAAWMGCTEGEMVSKYSAKLRSTSFELGGGILRAVRLNQSAKGNTVTVPRTPIEVAKIKVVPLFMMYAFTQGIKGVLESSIVEFTFLKDNHTERKLVSTLSSELLLGIYKDNNFVAKMLSSVDINTVQQGGLMLPSKIHRGYIKIPEVGSSRYDETGTRSLNLARVLKIREVFEIDKSLLDYIDVDLEKVKESFLNSVDYVLSKMPERMSEVYNLVGNTDKDTSGYDSMMYLNDIYDCVNSGEAMLSTQYKRDLHKIAISHPDLFPLYNASGATTGGIVDSSVSYGVGGELDF